MNNTNNVPWHKKVLDFHNKYSSVTKPLIYIFVLVFINALLPDVLNVVGIESSSYINYLLFINAMILFYILLPRKTGQIFL